MVTLNIKVTTEMSTTEFYCPNKVEAYKLALYLAEAGYKDIKITEGV
jgi:hypothetical protein